MKFILNIIFFLLFSTSIVYGQAKGEFSSSGKGEKIDTINVVSTKTDLDSLNRSYLRVSEMIEKVKNTNIHPGESVHYLPSGNSYKIESFTRYPVDTIITIPVENKGWENLFSNSNKFGNENADPVWNDLGTAFTVVERDTIHPVSLKNNVSAFVLTSSIGQTVYNNSEFNSTIYQANSTYTISFWARKGKRPQDSNVTLKVEFDYSGNPDVEQNVSITDDWQYFQLVFNTLGNDRVFSWILFDFRGDTGDKIYITDVQLNAGQYNGIEHYATNGQILEKTDNIYANYCIDIGSINYEELRGISGGDAESINYLTSICQNDEACGAIKINTNIILREQVFLREHVDVVGDFRTSALTGSSNNLLQNSRIIADLNDNTKSLFKSIGTSQVSGIKLDGFVIDFISDAKAIYESADDLGAQIENIHTASGADQYLQNGLIFNQGSVNCVVDNVKIRCINDGISGVSTNLLIKNSKVLTSNKGIVSKVGSGKWTIENCWLEDIENIGIDSDGNSVLNIYDLYTEHVPILSATNGATVRVSSADVVNIEGGILHQEPGIDNSNNIIELDTVTEANIHGNKFINTGNFYITTTENLQGLDAFGNKVDNGEKLFPNDWSGIADSSKVNVIDNSFVWFGKLKSTGADLIDTYIRSSNDKVRLEGKVDLFNDTLNFIGTQNLFRNSEQLVLPDWNFISYNDSVSQNVEGTAELFYAGVPASLRATTFGTDNYNVSNKIYTITYEAKIVSDSAFAYITPSFEKSGNLEDVTSSTDTISTDWKKYTHTLEALFDGYDVDFLIDADSVLLRNFSITEGYINEIYYPTTGTSIENSTVVLEGRIEFADELKISKYLGFNFGDDITASTYSIQPNDHFLRFNATSNNQVITLPNANGIDDGILIGEYDTFNNPGGIGNDITFVSAGGNIVLKGTESSSYVPAENTVFKVIIRDGKHVIFEY